MKIVLMSLLSLEKKQEAKMLLLLAVLFFFAHHPNVFSLETSGYHVYIEDSLAQCHNFTHVLAQTLLRYNRILSKCVRYQWRLCFSNEEQLVTHKFSIHLTDPCLWKSISVVYPVRQMLFYIHTFPQFQINLTVTKFTLLRSFPGCIYHALWVFKFSF